MRQVLARARQWPGRQVRDALSRTRRQVGDDLRSDRYLVYILAAAFVLYVFWIWHRLPNFATRDERWRVVDPVEVLAKYLDDPGIGAVQDGVTVWRAYGAMMYLSGVALLPVLTAVLLTGDLEAFANVGRHHQAGTGLWDHWQRTPAWIWTASVLLVRLTNVAFGVASVYLVYRIGTRIRDRATGRLAATLCTFTWGLVILVHEAGEDVPSLFFFLLAVYLAVRFLEDGTPRLFYAGCVAGGAAIAFKLSGGVSAIVLGAALVLRARRSDDGLPRGLYRPWLIGGGLVVALVTVAVGYPSIFFGAPGDFTARLSRALSSKSDPHGWRVEPGWWWIARGYLHGVGLPMALGFLGGVAAAIPRLRERSLTADALALMFVGTGTFLLVYVRWAYVRTHHLLPTFPLLIVVLAVGLQSLRESRPRVGSVVVAALVLTSALYTAAGTAAYANQPRDRASAWLEEHADEGETLETYVGDPQESAAPHGMDVSPVPPSRMFDVGDRCPSYIELGYHLPIIYLAPDDYSDWADSHSNPIAERYVRDLLAEDTYPYEVAATFGRKPSFVGGDPDPDWKRFLRVGIQPRTIQYGDPQDMGVDQYTVIMRRSGRCTPGISGPG